jgi:SOS-response transcriptional repressor LexA
MTDRDRRDRREAHREEQARLDRLTDPLVRLVADAHAPVLAPASPGAARLADWMVREMRARERPAERLTTARLATARERVLARMHGARLGVLDGGARPAVREPAPAWGAPDLPDRATRERSAPWIAFAAAAGVGREIWDEPCERWIELPDPVPRGAYVALSVSGDSMTPLFHPGDVILVRLGAAVERRSVVVARHPDDGYVLKEVGRVGRREIELRSLNPAYPPVRIPRAAELVVGTVVLRWCGHGG